MEFSNEQRLSQSAVNIYGSYGQKQLLRKINKPLVEKKRRARINTSLQQLKSLVVTALSKTHSKAKLEKADILEMTVKYIRNLQRQQYAYTATTDPNIVNKYRAGFMACIKEVSGFLTSMEGLDLDTKARVLDHLATALSASASPQAKSAMVADLPSSSSDSDDSPVKEPSARKQLYSPSDNDDIVSYALMDSGLGAELENSALDFDNDEDSNDDIYSHVQTRVTNPRREKMVPEYSRQAERMGQSSSRLLAEHSADYNNNHNNHNQNNNNANIGENVDENNNFSLPPIAQVFVRSRDVTPDMAASAQPMAEPETSETRSPANENRNPIDIPKFIPREGRPISTNHVVPHAFPVEFTSRLPQNFEKPRNPQILRVRCGNVPQERFGKMYNALTKPIFRKPYSRLSAENENSGAETSGGHFQYSRLHEWQPVRHFELRGPVPRAIQEEQPTGNVWRPW